MIVGHDRSQGPALRIPFTLGSSIMDVIKKGVPAGRRVVLPYSSGKVCVRIPSQDLLVQIRKVSCPAGVRWLLSRSHFWVIRLGLLIKHDRKQCAICGG